MLERTKGKLLFFEAYWVNNLNNRFENILTLQGLKKYEKKNAILDLLFFEYVESSVTTAILKIFETLRLYEKLGTGYKREGNLKQIVFYRNELIAHVEENYLDPQKREELLRNNTSAIAKIKIIRSAASDLINMINEYFVKNNFEKELTCRVLLSPKIKKDALITLFETILKQDQRAFE